MKKIISFILLSVLISNVYSQIITGTVYDKNTLKSIPNATVYFNGTYRGTFTDQNGFFKFDISNNISITLTISALGYYSTAISNLIIDNPYKIYLEPKIYDINEVVILPSGISEKRKINLETFKREFLGATINTEECYIMNESDITLNSSSFVKDSAKLKQTMVLNLSKLRNLTKIDTLKAFSKNPILINNKALGYNITYFLDKFEYIAYYMFNYEKAPYSESLIIQGNCIFKEDTITTVRMQKRFEQRREKSYLGSRMHFFRALWNDDLKSAGFTIIDSINRILTYDSIVSRPDIVLGENPQKYLTYRGYIRIAYRSEIPHSYIVIQKDSVHFNEDRVLDPSSTTWNGDMAKQRISDLLPYEYKIKK